MREIIFQNAIITVKTLNVLIAIGFLYTGTYIIRYIERHKMNLSFMTRHFVHIILSALIAGRIAYMIENLKEFITSPLSFFYVWDLKFSFFGMMIGATAMLFWLCKKNEEDFWTWFDALFLSTLAMLIFVHIGNFFDGKHYGLPTEMPWGITFDTTHIPFVTPIHPTQLYALVLTIALLVYSNIKGKRIHLSGVIGTRALMVYGLGMLGISFFYGDPSVYVRISYGIIAALAFVGQVHCSHKTHITN